MANIKSSKKAIKVIAKKTENNHELKARVKNLIRETEKAIAANDHEKASLLFKDVQKYLDQAVSPGGKTHPLSSGYRDRASPR